MSAVASLAVGVVAGWAVARWWVVAVPSLLWLVASAALALGAFGDFDTADCYEGCGRGFAWVMFTAFAVGPALLVGTLGLAVGVLAGRARGSTAEDAAPDAGRS